MFRRLLLRFRAGQGGDSGSAICGGASGCVIVQGMNAPSARVIEKHLVLVGAGNAHLVFVKRFGMSPLPGVAVTLVNEAAEVPYSAMVPAHIAGDYSRAEIGIDLVRLCAAVGVRFLADRVQRLDSAARTVHFAQRPPLVYDALSLGVGSVPVCPTEMPGETSLVLRPLDALLRRLEELEKELKTACRPFHFVVVGGGASGCELALAIHRRFGGLSGFRLTLLQAGPRLLPQFPAAAARAFHQVLAKRRIEVRANTRVHGGKDGRLTLANGKQLAFDAVLWATDAAPPRLLRDSGLALNPDGFLRVRDTLQSVSDDAVFGSGDCVSFESYPHLPRNGVYAVRHGAVLFDNIPAFFREQPLRPFRPQKFYLSLLNAADGTAVLGYGPLACKGRWQRRLKDRIDRAWINKFTHFAPPPTAENGEPAPMRCGGCGSKISSDVLSAVLRRLALPTDPRILLGCQSGEDAAVHRFRPELFGGQPEKLVEAQTVDFFKAFVDDPFLFGRIAALHAVSDLYAMNARPFSALAVVTLPYARGPIQEAQLFELLAGAVETFRPLGMVLTGGHTTEGSELALGFAVTGHGEEDRLFRKNRLEIGDRLVLTKPLGSGALLAAWMRGACRAAWFQHLTRSMLLSNGPAAAVFDRMGVMACTDITGFGLAGHLLEMLDASRLSARLDAARVPLLKGFPNVVDAGIVSTLQNDNAKQGCRIQSSAPLPVWLFDPQTSGGLLAAVKPARLAETLDCLHAAGFDESAAIGDVKALEAGGAPTIYL